ncbi:nuclease/transposase family protein [Halanaerobaculum tunisiense]
MNKTYIISTPGSQQGVADTLARKSGRIYSKVVSTVFKLKQKKDIWLSKNDMEKLIKLYSEDFGLHSQTKQGIVQQYYDNLKSYFKSRDKIENSKPPYRTKKYNKVIYKRAAIKLKENGVLRLSNGRKGKAFKIEVPSLTKEPKYAEFIYNSNLDKHQLHIVIDIENDKRKYKSDKVLAVDLGVIHPKQD